MTIKPTYVSADPTLLVPTVRCLSCAAVLRWLLVLSCSSSWLPTDASETLDPELPLRVMLYGSYMRKERMGSGLAPDIDIN